VRLSTLPPLLGLTPAQLARLSGLQEEDRNAFLDWWLDIGTSRWAR
jgi:hypothetical protein